MRYPIGRVLQKAVATVKRGSRRELISHFCRMLQVMEEPNWRLQQENDPDLQPVLHWLKRWGRPPWDDITGLSIATKGLWAKFYLLRLKEGVLQRAWKDPSMGGDRWQVVVPSRLKRGVLEACHGSTGTGHFDVTKTLRCLRQSFYLGLQRMDVEDFCHSCDACSSHKGPLDQSRAHLKQ